jgi:hypothetical protein
MFPNDTTRANAAIDSVLHSFDYDDRQDFNDDLKKAAQNSGTMREILDSVQIQLRRIQTKDR